MEKSTAINTSGKRQTSPEGRERSKEASKKQHSQKLKQFQQIEERAKFFEGMFRQAQENVHALNSEMRKKDIENEKLIMDLK